MAGFFHVDQASVPLLSLAYIMFTVQSWRMLAMHFVRLAWSRAFCRAGNRIAINSAMIPMTTSSSTSVNALRFSRDLVIKPSKTERCDHHVVPFSQPEVNDNSARLPH